MDLWTEFEGVTIDSSYSLKRLLQTEGRSAFFSTHNANGDPVLIRIIECHFDEEEILARWRGVEMMGHPAFLRIDRFGQFLIEEDEITAVYAVFERVDENLGHVLERGRLSVAEASQIGRSVASALETLHANGFVHEHVEARNIYAVGETVKMRSDCIRETPEGEAGEAARRRDIHDFAVLLTQVLRGMGGAANGRTALPAPFDEIVGNAMGGQWSLKEIERALTPPAAEKNGHEKKQARKAAEAKPAIATAALGADAALPSAGVKLKAETKPAPGGATPEACLFPMEADEAGTSDWPERRAKPARDMSADVLLPGQRRAPMDELPVIFGISQEDMRRWMTAGGVLLAVILMVVFTFHRFLAGNTQATARQPETASTQRPQIAPKAGPPPSSAHPAPPSASAGLGARWRVVVFTFSRKQQAQKKMLSMEQRFPALTPAVFSPHGKSPWLVTIGGAMERDAAYALARKARGMGLPRDTYAQNYNGR